MGHLFSERYEELLQDESNWFGGDDGGSVPYSAKVLIARVMEDFREPINLQPSRYDNYTVDTDALDLAIRELNESVDYRVVDLDMMRMGSGLDEVHALANVHTPHLFDLIELQYEELSDDAENGKGGFRGEINKVLREQDIPWILVDGRLVKIDPKQFEQDLKLKTLGEMKELKDACPLYQGAYDELRKAIDFLGRGDYAEAVINAEKSYESVLKVILGSESETEAANGLTKRLLEAGKLSLPVGLKPEALQSSVLMSLPIIRNKAAAHGSGATGREMSGPMANLAVNLACALNTYLIQETTGKE
ncbi:MULTISPECIES: hypothetical protein [Coriobacteriia]|jgi:hypothetical protein|uniref:DUF7014 domain-containing protein n=1 Tax=Coriobacteriia TaxID=84998 RepID=UPI000E4897E7|nr:MULTISPECIES: hypothetical protein [Coriobacteriia]RHO42160.1 hypothetical protein DW178_03305 [Eggerthella sp. AM16-19]